MRPIDFFDRGASLFPDNVCFHDGNNAFTYRNVHEKTHRIAQALFDNGVSTGAKAAVFSPNDVTAFECVLGIMRSGAAWIPVNARNALQENIQILQMTDCDFLFYHSGFEDAVSEIKSAVPRIKSCVCIGSESAHNPVLDEWRARFRGPAPHVDAGPQGIAAISPTGGTTGIPKAVVLTNLNVETMAANFVACMPYDAPPVHLVVAPITHTAGVIALPLMAHGATNIMMTKPDLGLILEYIERFKVTTLFLPPTVIYMLLQHPQLRSHDYSSLRYFLYGAAPMSVDKLKEAIEAFGPVMVQGYGQTEAPIMCTFLSAADHVAALNDPAQEKRLKSCGRPTLLTAVDIMDDAGNILPAGTTGEVVVRGNLVMSGYYKNAQETEKVSGFGWHHTGDIGYKDPEGYVYLVDRKKDMIITGGFNVYPAEIEHVLMAHPAVQDCAVIGVPDAKWGEAVKAIIELKSGMTATEDQFVALCQERLGAVKTPKSVEFWQSLPRSNVGKVLKREIRNKFWQAQDRMIG